MASQEQQYSAEFKAKVASEALDQNKQNLDQLSDKYDVPVSVILTWATKYEKDPKVFEKSGTEGTSAKAESDEDTVVNVEIEDEKVSRSISYGAMADNLDYKKLTFWSVLGIIFVIIFVQLLFEMYEMTTQINLEQLSAESEYHEVTEQTREARERLNSFGVVDIEEGTYRIPIDSVMNDMAVDGE